MFFLFPLVRLYFAWTIIIDFIKRINLFLLSMRFSCGWLLFLLLIQFYGKNGYEYPIFILGRLDETNYFWVLYLTVITIHYNIDRYHSLIPCYCWLFSNTSESVWKSPMRRPSRFSNSNLLHRIDRNYHIQKEIVFSRIVKCEWCCTSVLHMEFLLCFYGKRLWVQLNDLHVLLNHLEYLGLL